MRGTSSAHQSPAAASSRFIIIGAPIGVASHRESRQIFTPLSLQQMQEKGERRKKKGGRGRKREKERGRKEEKGREGERREGGGGLACEIE